MPREFAFKPGTILKARRPEDNELMEFRFAERLRNGESSLFHEARSSDGRPVIIKAPLTRDSVDITRHVERSVLTELASPNLPRLVAQYENSADQVFLVLERLFPNPLLTINHPAIADRLEISSGPGARFLPLDAPTALELSCELLLALRALHANRFIHGDVKLGNLLIRPDYRSPKLEDPEVLERVRLGAYRGVLIDLGGARSFDYLEALNGDASDPNLIAPPCTPLFAAPEALVAPIQYGPAMDIYAAGLAIATLLTGHGPYDHLRPRVDPRDRTGLLELKQAERRGEIAPFVFPAIANAPFDNQGLDSEHSRRELNRALFELLQRATHPEPAERGDIEDLLAELTALGRFRPSGFGDHPTRLEARQGLFDPGRELATLAQAIALISEDDSPRPAPRQRPQLPTRPAAQATPRSSSGRALRRIPTVHMRRPASILSAAQESDEGAEDDEDSGFGSTGSPGRDEAGAAEDPAEMTIDIEEDEQQELYKPLPETEDIDRSGFQ